jgi:hypothetical protein
MNIIPKHFGQATVASRAPQCSHTAESVETVAPHDGQFSVSAGMGISFHISLFTVRNSQFHYIFRWNLYSPELPHPAKIVKTETHKQKDILWAL